MSYECEKEISETSTLISIIIRCKNEARFIRQCLNRLIQQSGNFTTEIIIVDSGSTDSTLQICSEFPTQILQIPDCRFTYGYACNFGVSNSRGDLVVFISAHSYPIHDDWLTLLSSPFKDPSVVATTGFDLCMCCDASPIEAWRIETYQSNYPDQLILSLDLPYLSNSNAMYKQEFLQANPFDENVLGAEDTLWLVNTLQQYPQVKIISIPQATAHHYHPLTFSETFRRFRIHGAIAAKTHVPKSLKIFNWAKIIMGQTIILYRYMWRNQYKFEKTWFIKLSTRYCIPALFGLCYGRYCHR